MKYVLTYTQKNGEDIKKVFNTFQDVLDFVIPRFVVDAWKSFVVHARKDL